MRHVSFSYLKIFLFEIFHPKSPFWSLKFSVSKVFNSFQFNFIQLNYHLLRGFNHICFADTTGLKKRQMIFEDLQNIFEDEDLSRIHKGSLKSFIFLK